MLIVLFAMKMARNDQASFSFPSGKKKGGGKKERQKLPTDRAPLGGEKKKSIRKIKVFLFLSVKGQR